ncbi:hypothetical protein D3C80_1339380 [compost metagenome]
MRCIEERFVVPDEPGQLLGQHDVELFDHRMLTGHQAAAFDKVAVQGRIILPRGQAAIAPPSFVGQLRVDPVQITQNLVNGVAQAVNVQTAELDTTFRGVPVVVPMQPVDECSYLGVAPHPGREPTEDVALPG